MDESEPYSDSYLLEYVLDRYRISKQNLIDYLLKKDLLYAKQDLFKQFYLDYPEFHTSVPIPIQYRELLEWNRSDIVVTQKELEDYYLEHIK